MDNRLYGIETVMDLHDCDPVAISSESKLREYLEKIVKVLDMVPYGEPLVERFGLNTEHTAGYSIVQLIETSSITGHFSEAFKSAHINVFSCKAYDGEVVDEFTRRFFGASSGTKWILQRYGTRSQVSPDA
jgi:S-adenosylmethionine decarboxylase